MYMYNAFTVIREIFVFGNFRVISYHVETFVETVEPAIKIFQQQKFPKLPNFFKQSLFQQIHKQKTWEELI